MESLILSEEVEGLDYDLPASRSCSLCRLRKSSKDPHSECPSCRIRCDPIDRCEACASLSLAEFAAYLAVVNKRCSQAALRSKAFPHSSTSTDVNQTLYLSTQALAPAGAPKTYRPHALAPERFLAPAPERILAPAPADAGIPMYNAPAPADAGIPMYNAPAPAGATMSGPLAPAPTLAPVIAHAPTMSHPTPAALAPALAPTFAPALAPTLAPTITTAPAQALAPAPTTVGHPLAYGAAFDPMTFLGQMQQMMQSFLPPALAPVIARALAPTMTHPTPALAPTLAPTLAPALAPALAPTLAPTPQPTFQSAPALAPGLAPTPTTVGHPLAYGAAFDPMKCV